MWTLHHYPLCAASRLIRLMLAEKGCEAELREQKFWEQDPNFIMLNPASETPVLETGNGLPICYGPAIMEFLEEDTPTPSLIGTTPMTRAEARRIFGWFHDKFNREVTVYLIGEKLMTRLQRHRQPHTAAIRAGSANIRIHLEYIGYLTGRRRYLAGNDLTIADLGAAAHLSLIDYLGDVPWDDFKDAREWYARIKSRPSFRSILQDQVPGYPPSSHYADLDF